MKWYLTAVAIVCSVVLLLIIAVGLMQAHGQSRDLTAEQARNVLAVAGINPGTVRQIGDMGRYMLRSVDVTHGRERGEFMVRIRIEALP